MGATKGIMWGCDRCGVTRFEESGQRPEGWRRMTLQSQDPDSIGSEAADDQREGVMCKRCVGIVRIAFDGADDEAGRVVVEKVAE